MQAMHSSSGRSGLPLLALLALSLAGCRPGAKSQVRAASAPHRQARKPPQHRATRDAERCNVALAHALSGSTATTRVVAYIPGHDAAADGLATSVSTVFDTLRRALPDAIDLSVERADEPGADTNQRRGTDVIVVSYEHERERVVELSATGIPGMQYRLVDKIRVARDKAAHVRRRIGVVVGKGGIGVDDRNLVSRAGRARSPSVQSVIEEAFPTYSLVPVDVTKAQPIDPALEGLIITQPAEAWTDAELRRVDDFVMHGGNALAIFASAASFAAHDSTMSARLDTHRLDRLTAGYGIAMGTDVVGDVRSHFVVPVMTGSGMMQIDYLPAIVATQDGGAGRDGAVLDARFPGFFAIDSLAFPYVSSLRIVSSAQPRDVTPHIVAQTSDQTVLCTRSPCDLAFHPGSAAAPTATQQAIAIVVEGKLQSAFAPHRRAASSSAVLVVSSGMYMANPFAYLGNGAGGQEGDAQLQLFAGPYAQRHLTNAIVSVKDVLDWMVFGRSLEPCLGWPPPAWLTEVTSG